ncbi:MAG: PAS domain-containing protein [Methylohalobius sp.]|nr:PAS domain-containing protein [Methylohalobius sp.]
MRQRPVPKNQERRLGENDFIVSKTDTTGKITYANRIFMEICGYTERELLGTQHNIIRHPDMPHGAFWLLWDTIQKKQEFFAFVKNLTKDGSFYWVFANVTPDLDNRGHIAGYYSVRRQAPTHAIRAIEPIYREMLAIEQKAGSVKQGIQQSVAYLQDFLKNKGITYEQLVLDLYGARA